MSYRCGAVVRVKDGLRIVAGLVAGRATTLKHRKVFILKNDILDGRFRCGLVRRKLRVGQMWLSSRLAEVRQARRMSKGPCAQKVMGRFHYRDFFLQFLSHRFTGLCKTNTTHSPCRSKLLHQADMSRQRLSRSRTHRACSRHTFSTPNHIHIYTLTR